MKSFVKFVFIVFLFCTLYFWRFFIIVGGTFEKSFLFFLWLTYAPSFITTLYTTNTQNGLRKMDTKE